MADRTDDTNRSAEEVMEASTHIRVEAGLLTAEFERFFTALREGPGIRPRADDPARSEPQQRPRGVA
jgi:hypothetical protein